MSNKLDKFGLVFWMEVNAESKYMLKTFSYLGKNESRPTKLTLNEHAVFCLLQLYTKTGKKVTTDNFLSSLHLAKLLKQQNFSILGTINQIKKEIPKEIK